MSALGDVATGAGGALAGQLWKVATLVLLAVLLAGGGAGGALWWTAAAARDQALADLRAEQGINAQLRAGVDAQNTAILAQATLAREAEARGQAAMQAAAANGRRYDQALQQIAGARATSCTDAMPYVNQLLEKVR
ncbi:hypothetical protein FHW58_003394 [Duganella sp. 1224]|uniref:hypothetical protein n=1 Tax=Duganella sp. 1224 TaxID=2587052 RepID=UPI0015CA5F45|nr:hypothetical protein [Duganella sp. 1224]NYE62179.1 hypothetical protein [Duganella sp. 1224]